MFIEMNDLTKIKPLFNIENGELFIYDNELYMASNESNAQLRRCVHLSNGSLIDIYNDMVVKSIPNERAKVVIE